MSGRGPRKSKTAVSSKKRKNIETEEVSIMKDENENGPTKKKAKMHIESQSLDDELESIVAESIFKDESIKLKSLSVGPNSKILQPLVANHGENTEQILSTLPVINNLVKQRHTFNQDVDIGPIDDVSSYSTMSAVNLNIRRYKKSINNLQHWMSVAKVELSYLNDNKQENKDNIIDINTIHNKTNSVLQYPFCFLSENPPFKPPSDFQIGGIGPMNVDKSNIKELETRRDEISVLIKKFQDKCGRQMPIGEEPPRNKAHWDYLLGEMAWMANDFVREQRVRKIVLQKITRGIKSYWSRYGSKDVRELKAQEAKKRKLANGLSRQMKKFWGNIHKLVRYKYNAKVEQYNKKALDAHLNILVEQTESYTKDLAKTITTSSTPIPTTTTTTTTPLPSNETITSSTTIPPPPTTTTTPIITTTTTLSSDDTKPPPPSTAAPTPKEQKEDKDAMVDDYDFVLENEEKDDETTMQEAEHDVTEADIADELKGLNDDLDMPIEEILRQMQESGVYEDDDEDDEHSTSSYIAEDEVDDEGTIDADEIDEDEEIRSKRHRDELKALNDEANMDVEELKRQYGYYQTRDTDDDEYESPHSSEEHDDEDDEQQEDVDESEEESDEDNDDNNDDDITSLIEKKPIVEGDHSAVDAAVAKAAKMAPQGVDFSTVTVKSTVPHLLRGELREYQHIGLDWLVSMYENNLNGILADQMGLGKTIQTIALLGWLAVEKGIWGQHLIVVPTSVIVNWELEFKRFLPGFKIMSYYGNAKERKQKRIGWSNPNTFHVCITSYQLILMDQSVFKRKKWHYLILDEAHNIKNFKSQRWQVMLNFRTHSRLLLTGTPLQNDMMELWSLMHFLMPSVFESQSQFKEWFSNPVTSMVEGKVVMNQEIVSRLHGVLRPFLLRRLKSNVAKQLPAKHEHTIKCRLSKRQRLLYEEFMMRSDTRKTLAGGSFLSMMNVLMQLRKVCNHPDIFAGRPIVSPFKQDNSITYYAPKLLSKGLRVDFPPTYTIENGLNLNNYQLILSLHEELSTYDVKRISELTDYDLFISTASSNEGIQSTTSSPKKRRRGTGWEVSNQAKQEIDEAKQIKIVSNAIINQRRCQLQLTYGNDLMSLIRSSIIKETSDIHLISEKRNNYWNYSNALLNAVKLPSQRADDMKDILTNFVCLVPLAIAPPIQYKSLQYSTTFRSENEDQYALQRIQTVLRKDENQPYQIENVRKQLNFPDRRLIQWDCGKLQQLARMLTTLKRDGHRVLLFTQMTRMLDILESFLNIYAYTYLRLDGSTKVHERQRMMERFNSSDKYFVFILSTRSGGVGVNLTGADTVIFYDTDWNPAMDAQAQDRCHRIGQTREVNIYRLVTENSIEENILAKSMQKRRMNDMVIGDGQFNTEFFNKIDPRELLGLDIDSVPLTGQQMTGKDMEKAMASVEDASDRLATQQVRDEYQEDINDFKEQTTDELKKNITQLPTMQFEDGLTNIQRYAMHFAEAVDPVVPTFFLQAPSSSDVVNNNNTTTSNNNDRNTMVDETTTTTNISSSSSSSSNHQGPQKRKLQMITAYSDGKKQISYDIEKERSHRINDVQKTDTVYGGIEGPNITQYAITNDNNNDKSSKKNILNVSKNDGAEVETLISPTIVNPDLFYMSFSYSQIDHYSTYLSTDEADIYRDKYKGRLLEKRGQYFTRVHADELDIQKRLDDTKIGLLFSQNGWKYMNEMYMLSPPQFDEYISQCNCSNNTINCSECNHLDVNIDPAKPRLWYELFRTPEEIEKMWGGKSSSRNGSLQHHKRRRITAGANVCINKTTGVKLDTSTLRLNIPKNIIQPFFQKHPNIIMKTKNDNISSNDLQEIPASWNYANNKFKMFNGDLHDIKERNNNKIGLFFDIETEKAFYSKSIITKTASNSSLSIPSNTSFLYNKTIMNSPAMVQLTASLPTMPEEWPGKARVPWTEDEDRSLCRVVEEYGFNWGLAKDILGSDPTLSGRLRSAKECQHRLVWLLQHPNVVYPKPRTSQYKSHARSEDRSNSSSNTANTDDRKEKKRKKKTNSMVTPGGFGSPDMNNIVSEGMTRVYDARRTARAVVRKLVPSSVLKNKLAVKSFVSTKHASHTKAVKDAHIAMGIPAAAIGKTLMPHNIIQLRQRRARKKLDESARLAMMAKQRAQQQQVQKQQVQQQQVHDTNNNNTDVSGGGHPQNNVVPNNNSNNNVNKNIASSSVSNNNMKPAGPTTPAPSNNGGRPSLDAVEAQRQQQLQLQQQQLNMQKAAAEAGRQQQVNTNVNNNTASVNPYAAAATNQQQQQTPATQQQHYLTNEFLNHVILTQPSLKPVVQEILGRTNMNVNDKLVLIRRLWEEAKVRSSTAPK